MCIRVIAINNNGSNHSISNNGKTNSNVNTNSISSRKAKSDNTIQNKNESMGEGASGSKSIKDISSGGED